MTSGSLTIPFLEPGVFLQRLRHLLEAGRIEAGRRSQPVLVSLTVAVDAVHPLQLFQRARGQTRFFWEQPDRGLAMVAMGTAALCTGDAERRFEQVGAAYRQLVSQALLDTESACPLPPPVALGGFAFDPMSRPHPAWEDYPDALLIIPRFLFVARGDTAWCTVNLRVAALCDLSATAESVADALHALGSENCTAIAADPAEVFLQPDDQRGRWQNMVSNVVEDIQRGTVEKLVLARQVPLQARPSFNTLAALRRLRADYGHCTLFAFARGTSCFLGATPERLVRLQGRAIQVDCLAASSARGVTADEDDAIADALLADRKERYEHALVVRTLQDTLAPLCASLSTPSTPHVLRLPNVQHLHTPLEGRLKDHVDLLALVARLHPTPSVGGLPRAATLPLIRAYEAGSRGWYAGPIGWIDGHGGGEFVVGIRSALVRQEKAWLYAGCGIVSGSDPEREYAESCLKLRPMLSALGGSLI